MSRSIFIAFVVAAGLWAQGGDKKTSGPAPPPMKQPGIQNPGPIPDQKAQPIPPGAEVRRPKHETGRERAVSSEKKEPSTKKKTKKDSSRKQAEP